MTRTKSALLAAAITLTACADDGVEPTIEGHWTITADVKPCRDELVQIDFTVSGDEVAVPDMIDGSVVQMIDFDTFKHALVIVTESATWQVQVDIETEEARVWYSDGSCSIGAAPAVSVEHAQ